MEREEIINNYHPSIYYLPISNELLGDTKVAIKEVQYDELLDELRLSDNITVLKVNSEIGVLGMYNVGAICQNNKIFDKMKNVVSANQLNILQQISGSNLNAKA